MVLSELIAKLSSTNELLVPKELQLLDVGPVAASAHC